MASPTILVVIRLLLFGAAGVASYLAWTSLTQSPIAGCGPDSDCSRVLGSRWAFWFGLPVSLFALGTYGAMLVGTWRVNAAAGSAGAARWRQGLVAGAAMILGAAIWFFALQWFVLKSFCPYCLVAHGLGAVASGLTLFVLARGQGAGVASVSAPEHPRSLAGVIAGVAGVMVLVAGQLVHQPRTFAVQPVEVVEGTKAPPPARRVHSIYNGQFNLDVQDVPLLGSVSAPHLLVSLFDYTCHHCRLMHPRLKFVQQNLSNDVAVISLPMPLASECNPTVTRTHYKHANACDYARIGLAVWRARSDAFEPYNEWFFEPETPVPVETARNYARGLVGTNAFDQALADPWVEARLKEDVAIYEAAYRAGRGNMPQLIIGTNLYLGTLSMDELGRALSELLWR
ncbi:MAG TPA: vitamin K epoxide reductase family protein [Methylomirabilota bacterium]|nr:vitamin K epoxide reductase family protein [Methylomirabilota bacterium]